MSKENVLPKRAGYTYVRYILGHELHVVKCKAFNRCYNHGATE